MTALDAGRNFDLCLEGDLVFASYCNFLHWTTPRNFPTKSATVNQSWLLFQSILCKRS